MHSLQGTSYASTVDIRVQVTKTSPEFPPDSEEMDRLKVALKGVLSVSKGDSDRLLAEDKAENADSKKRDRKVKGQQ